MRLQEIMTGNVITIGMDDRLGVVKNIFDSKGFHHLLVVGDDKPLGRPEARSGRARIPG